LAIAVAALDHFSQAKAFQNQDQVIGPLQNIKVAEADGGTILASIFSGSWKIFHSTRTALSSISLLPARVSVSISAFAFWIAYFTCLWSPIDL
jgi:hypothetical protein